MKKKLVFWVEKYFYDPNIFQKLLSYILLPISFLYCFIMKTRFFLQKEEDFNIPIISIGNLNVGGNGKTPLVTALASQYELSAVILRGYGRKSKGLYVVRDFKNILCDVYISGDEAQIYADKLPNSIVIVSEDRKKAILKAKEMGAKIIFLDDAYSKHDIKKLDIVIDIDTKNRFCLPSGAFRDILHSTKKVIILKENIDFTRIVTLKNKTDKMSLVTAIARPERLDKYLPKVISKNYFEDHHTFTKEEIDKILFRDNSESLLITYKDFVKLKYFDVKLSLLDLDIKVDNKVFELINSYN
ncbi:MAG: tetraacyldisaccharide 4'-kinase [Campylobacterales bacterium]